MFKTICKIRRAYTKFPSYQHGSRCRFLRKPHLLSECYVKTRPMTCWCITSENLQRKMSLRAFNFVRITQSRLLQTAAHYLRAGREHMKDRVSFDRTACTLRVHSLWHHEHQRTPPQALRADLFRRKKVSIHSARDCPVTCGRTMTTYTRTRTPMPLNTARELSSDINAAVSECGDRR